MGMLWYFVIVAGIAIGSVLIAVGGLIHMVRKNNELLSNHLTHHDDRIEPRINRIDRSISRILGAMQLSADEGED